MLNFCYVIDKSDTEFLKAIGLNVSKYRNKTNISQAQLAFEINTTLRQIQRIEAGTANFSILYLKKIAEILNIKLTILIDK